VALLAVRREPPARADFDWRAAAAKLEGAHPERLPLPAAPLGQSQGDPLDAG
jgi:hypothetical protein